jgi:hypothetical protein
MHPAGLFDGSGMSPVRFAIEAGMVPVVKQMLRSQVQAQGPGQPVGVREASVDPGPPLQFYSKVGATCLLVSRAVP